MVLSLNASAARRLATDTLRLPGDSLCCDARGWVKCIDGWFLSYHAGIAVMFDSVDFGNGVYSFKYCYGYGAADGQLTGDTLACMLDSLSGAIYAMLPLKGTNSDWCAFYHDSSAIPVSPRGFHRVFFTPIGTDGGMPKYFSHGRAGAISVTERTPPAGTSTRIAMRVAVHAGYPGGIVRIRYSLPVSGADEIRIRISDMRGALVWERSMAGGRQCSGIAELAWNNRRPGMYTVAVQATRDGIAFARAQTAIVNLH
jgi:hypothetical protein